MKPNTAYVDLEGTIEAKEGDKVALFTMADATPYLLNKNVEGRPVLKGNKMALDKVELEKIIEENKGKLTNPARLLVQGYALGVKDERERLAKQFDESGWHPYAELIRNSSNDHT